MRKSVSLLTLVAISLATTPTYAASDSIEPSLPVDNRIKVLMYDESDVYTISTKYGYQTNVVFSPSEEIQTISVGDRSLWQIIPSANRLFIRPMEQDIITNMTVLTNKRSYQFDLKSVAAETKETKGNIVYVAKFFYPDDMPRRAASMMEMPVAAAPVTPVEAPPAPVAEVVPTETPKEVVPAQYTPSVNEPVIMASTTETTTPPKDANFNYTFTGPDDLAPLQVYDDGKSTYFKYRAIGQPLPNVYIVASNGDEQPVTRYVKNDMMVIDAVVNKLSLKNSNGTVLIYNETMNPL